jgi:hypothetical protein
VENTRVQDSSMRARGTVSGFKSGLIAVFLFLVFFGLYSALPSTTLIGDGLRHLPALRTVVPGDPVRFEPKPWLEVYRHYYDDVVVHNHVLFGLLARAGFAASRFILPGTDAVLAMRLENSFSAALAVALFFLLLERLGTPRWGAIFSTMVLGLTPGYVLIATNITEAGLALPFFLGSLLLLAQQQFTWGRLLLLAITAALAADIYLLAGTLVPCIVFVLLTEKQPNFARRIGTAVGFIGIFAVFFLGIWTGILFLSGMRQLHDLAIAVLRFPQQGTYGGFRATSLVATPLGLTQALLAILPDSFLGLRLLLRNEPLTTMLAACATLVCLFVLVSCCYRLWISGDIRKPAILASVLALLVIEGVCVEWDPYYSKLQLFAAVLFFVIIAVGFPRNLRRPPTALMVIFLLAVMISGVRTLAINQRPSLAAQNAVRLHKLVGEDVLITGWSADVVQLWLYSNGTNVISIPDFALARHLQMDRVEADLNALLQQSAATGRSVFFYGMFDPENKVLNYIETRFRLNGFSGYMKSFESEALPVANFEQPGAQNCLLYEYHPIPHRTSSGADEMH